MEPTQIEYKLGNTKVPPISVVNGVGQGRPESSLTFNLSIDFLIRHISDHLSGCYEVEDVAKIKILAHAYDIITFASSRKEAIEQAECVVSMLKKIGLDINTGKCVSISIASSENLCSGEMLADNLPIPIQSDYNVKFRYLGCDISTSEGPNYNVWSRDIAINVKNLIDFPHLEPWQKIELIRIFVISQLIYKSQIEADHGALKHKAISDLITTIQQAVRTILGLQCIPSRHLYGSRPAGLACPNSQWTVVTNVLVTLARLKNSNDIVTEALKKTLTIDINGKIDDILRELNADKIFENSLEIGKIHDILNDGKKLKSKRITEALRAKCISLWNDTKSGKSAASTLLQQSMVTKSTMQFAKKLTKSQFTALLQIRSGCPNLRTRPHVHADSLLCRKCNSALESIGHVLGKCPELHGMIVKRHDSVVEYIFKFLKQHIHADVYMEPHYNVNGRVLKPDIIYINRENGKIIIIDPTVRIEIDQETRMKQINEKRIKYEPLRSHLADLYGLDITNIYVCPLWIGSRGTIIKTDISELIEFVGSISKFKLEELMDIVVSWSTTIYNSLLFS